MSKPSLATQVFEHIPEFRSVDMSAVVKPPERKNENVIVENIKPKLAFAHFAGQVFVPNNQEFVVTPASQKDFESPFERLNRLKYEVGNFHQELQELSNSKHESVRNVCSQIKSELDSLLSQLTNTTLPSISMDIDNRVNVDKASAVREITLKAENLSNSVSIETRISKLEETVGSTSILASLPNSNISSMLQALVSRVEQLDKGKLDLLEKKMKSILEMNTLYAANSKSDRSELDTEKISVVLANLSKFDAAATSLPLVISRLASLARIHEGLANLINRLHSIENNLEKMELTAKQDEELVSKLQITMMENANVLKSNMDILQQKYQEISKRLDSLHK